MAEKTRTLGTTSVTRNATVDAAAQQAIVDAAFAAATEDYWTAETLAANLERVGTAAADINFWTVQEAAHVAAADAIDDVLQSDWSAFLVAKASAHADWWDNVADDYACLVLNRNAVETAWQATISKLAKWLMLARLISTEAGAAAVHTGAAAINADYAPRTDCSPSYCRDQPFLPRMIAATKCFDAKTSSCDPRGKEASTYQRFRRSSGGSR